MYNRPPIYSLKDLTVDRETGSLVFSWILLAVSSLTFAGVFAFLVAMARTPIIQNILPGRDYFYIALVTHVDLSVVIWFATFMGALWVLTSTALLNTKVYSKQLGWAGFTSAAIGTVLILISAFSGSGGPILSNYVPVLTHPLFYGGFILFAFGVFLTIVNTLLSVRKAIKSKSYSKPFPFISYGMSLGGIIVLVAIICFGIAYSFLRGGPLESPLGGAFFERLFWGGGHILQFANTAGMVIAWTILIYLVFKTPLPFSDRLAKIFFVPLILFVLPGPILYFLHDITSQAHRDSFTMLMQFGLGPTTGIFTLAVLAVTWSHNQGGLFYRVNTLPWKKPGFSALILSVILFSLGGLISLKIQGSNVKIPSHYHGVIGAVTLSFMGLTYYILPLLKREVYSIKTARLQPYLYGIGQILFVIGMFWAGTQGVPRKTFGSAQILRSYPEYAGMAIMGLGGIIAIAGGATYVLNVLISLLRKGGRAK